jgi:hypothetical protein
MDYYGLNGVVLPLRCSVQLSFPASIIDVIIEYSQWRRPSAPVFSDVRRSAQSHILNNGFWEERYSTGSQSRSDGRRDSLSLEMVIVETKAGWKRSDLSSPRWSNDEYWIKRNLDDSMTAKQCGVLNERRVISERNNRALPGENALRFAKITRASHFFFLLQRLGIGWVPYLILGISFFTQGLPCPFPRQMY